MKDNLTACIRGVLLTSSLALVACGGSDNGGSSNTVTPQNTVQVSGTISAPGGQVAFMQPTGLSRMLASVFIKPVHAAIEGILPVGIGVTVNLIEVDADGNQVGEALATTTTLADGSFTLEAPEGFEPGPQYVIRAEGTTETIEARVTTLAVEVDPVSNAVSELVTTTAEDLGTLTVEEVVEIENAVEEVAEEVDPTSLNVAGLSEMLQTEALANEEINNVINSTVAPNEICGRVVDDTGTALDHIRIVVRDFGNWVTRAKGFTDANGDYCVNVPAGDYILGALNFTDTSMAASEWWSSGGDAYYLIDADRVSVGAGETVTRDFALEPGARISGSVLAGAGGTLAEGTPLENVRAEVRDFTTLFPLGGPRVDADGNYRINVIPGTYMVGVVNNKRLYPYASETYNGGAGGSGILDATPLNMNVGDTVNVDFSLEPGVRVFGEVIDGSSLQPVTGVRVRVRQGGPLFVLRTNREGRYSVWLKPGSYNLDCYGQTMAADLTAGGAQIDFTAAVGTLTAVLEDTAGNPVSQAKVQLRNAAGGFVGNEVSSSDGSVTLYTDTSGDYLVEILIDAPQPHGSTIYNGKTQLFSGDLVAMTVGSQSGPLTVVLPDAGVLTGTVRNNDGSPAANVPVQVRSGGLSPNERFVTTRTRGNGVYNISLPAGTYNRVIAIGSTGTPVQDSVVVNTGESTTVDLTLP